MKKLSKYIPDKLKNKKGVALVIVAGVIIALFALAALAIDIAYMYLVKNELQVAADAAALAGAALLTGEPDSSPSALLQERARQEAWRFACRNKAAGQNVYLVTNASTNCDAPPPATALNGSNSDNSDIVVGHWRNTSPGPIPCPTGWETFGSGYFCRANGNTDLTINAIKVKPKRTGETPGMPPVSLFLGRIIGLLPEAKAWPVMSASADAIAARPPRAEVPITICLDTCNPGVIDQAGTLLYWSPYPKEVNPGDVGIAWTSFNETSQRMENDVINSILCGKKINACNRTIYTANGYVNDLARQFRCAFKNPLYDSLNKTCSDGNCNSTTDNVTSWTVLVAIVQSPNGCPPGDQPTPDTVVSYGRMRITEVYARGGGGTNECACQAYDAPQMTGPQPNAIRVDRIECLACPATEFLGSKPVLVK